MYAQLGFRELDLERVLRTLVSTSVREDLLLSCWPRQRVNHERPGSDVETTLSRRNRVPVSLDWSMATE